MLLGLPRFRLEGGLMVAASADNFGIADSDEAPLTKLCAIQDQTLVSKRYERLQIGTCVY